MKANFTIFSMVLASFASASPADLDSRPISTEEIINKELKTLDIPMEVGPNTEIVGRIKQYVVNGRVGSEIVLGRSQLYFPIFEYFLKKYGLPEELKYLSIVESALVPKIRSHVGAVGLWQFMKPTAHHYGMTINSYVDDRMDPYRSTENAVIMLSDLYYNYLIRYW